VGHYASQRRTRSKGEPDRSGLTILGTRGVIQLTTGSLPPVVYLNDPSWFPGRGKSAWQTITSAGLGRPEPTKDGGLGQGNVWIARDLMQGIEADRQPRGSMYEGPAPPETTRAAYETERPVTAVELPLKYRAHTFELS